MNELLKKSASTNAGAIPCPVRWYHSAIFALVSIRIYLLSLTVFTYLHKTPFRPPAKLTLSAAAIGVGGDKIPYTTAYSHRGHRFA